ncbi:MAG: phenylalanine--tRNA ligase subunit beta [bacterium]|nr:phenylalanine--tRNA ligase subunit beta [bacterium]
MRAPLSWLREYVELPEPAEALVERLPMLGIGVEGVERAGGDLVLDLEIASNRPDLLSMIGIARELAAWAGCDAHLPEDDLDEVDPPASSMAAVEIADASLCPRYVAHVITGITVGSSPPAIAARLEAAGIRPVNAVVDATNYVMLEWGQPLHAFDLDALHGRRIIVRSAAAGEHLVTLDGVGRTLDPAMLVIADARRPVALAGIMGGAETEIGPGTHTVLLEAASFAPAGVRRTSRRIGLRTEASARFERGVDPEGVARAARRAAGLIAGLSGGRVLRFGVDVYPAPVPRPVIRLRLPRLVRVLGVEIPPDEVVSVLTRLGLEVRLEGDSVFAVPPVGRRDLEREEDLVEEVARHHGYDRIPEAMPCEIMQQGRRPVTLEAEGAARDALVRAGLTEAMTLSLVHPRALDQLGVEEGDPWRLAVPISNPLTADHTHLRSALLPGLLEAVRVNVARRQGAIHLFEIGRTFRAEGGVVRERRALAIAMRGVWLAGFWEDARDLREATLLHLRGVLETLSGELRAGPLAVEAGGPAWMHPARCGRVSVGGVEAGVMGELHPQVAARFDLPGRTCVSEMDLDVLLGRAVLQPRFTGMPRYPAVVRDVALVAPLGLPHAAVQGALVEAGGALLESVELFDAYTGPPLAPGTRNLAYTLTFRAPDRTLTGEEIEGLMLEICAALAARLPVKVRA